MTSNFHSSLSCPSCGQVNALTTRDLPHGTPVHCSHCAVEIGRWNTVEGEEGFVPAMSANHQHLDIDAFEADVMDIRFLPLLAN